MIKHNSIEWNRINPILRKGEVGIITDKANKCKIGDGVTPWRALAWEEPEVINNTEELPELEIAPLVRLAKPTEENTVGTEEDKENYNLDPEPYIIINPDRTITIPASLKEIAIQYDSKVETVTFKCPRYWDNINLSEGTVVMYCKHSGLPDTEDSPVTQTINPDNVQIPEGKNYFTFDWTIDNSLTQVAGALTFSINISNAIDENSWSWNTRICENGFAVLPGLSGIPGNVSFTEYELLTNSLNTYKNEMAENINTKKVTGLDAPNNNTDATSKEYVDEQIATIQNQFNNSVLDRIEFSVFKQWGIVGDSLSVGYTRDSEREQHPRNIEYSWGQHLARKMGNNCLHFGAAGIGAEQWMTNP